MSTKWIEVGSRVAEYTSGNPSSVEFSTVTALTATQIVVGGGRRYRRKDGGLVGESRHSWAGNTELLPPDDEAVVRQASRQILTRILGTVRDITKEAKPGVDGAEQALVGIEEACLSARAALARIASL